MGVLTLCPVTTWSGSNLLLNNFSLGAYLKKTGSGGCSCTLSLRPIRKRFEPKHASISRLTIRLPFSNRSFAVSAKEKNLSALSSHVLVLWWVSATSCSYFCCSSFVSIHLYQFYCWGAFQRVHLVSSCNSQSSLAGILIFHHYHCSGSPPLYHIYQRLTVFHTLKTT